MEEEINKNKSSNLNNSFTRIIELDALRGLVIILMILDHTRDFFHNLTLSGFNPLNLDYTTPIFFLTRWVTHLCAPAFIIIAGFSAFLWFDRKKEKSKKDLSIYLFSRGLLLVFLEITIVSFSWSFNFNIITFQIIWALGISMIFLSLLIFLKPVFNLIFSLLFLFFQEIISIFFNNHFSEIINIIFFRYGELSFNNIILIFEYPIFPIIFLMSLGYSLGFYYKKFNLEKNSKSIMYTGLFLIFIALILRLIKFGDYGSVYTLKDSLTFTILSFINFIKYPMSTQFIFFMTGISMVMFYFFKKIRFDRNNFLVVIGSVPLFIYIIHIYLIHITSILFFMIISDIGINLFYTYMFFILFSIICVYIAKLYIKYIKNKNYKFSKYFKL